MTLFPTAEQVIELHVGLLARHGGLPGLRDENGLESAVAQPRATFGGEELYPTLAEKAAALAFSPIRNHPFVDGNKRVGYAAADVFLRANGFKIGADVDEAEAITLAVAAGTMSREDFTAWVCGHTVAMS
jgi:death on curing protein